MLIDLPVDELALERKRRMNRAKSRRHYIRHMEAEKARVRKRRAENPEKVHAVEARSYLKCKQKRKERRYRWGLLNKERLRQNDLRFHALNPGKMNAYANERRARKLFATPKWVDRNELTKIYVEAKAKKLHVDHIIPLKHKLVCGLHVPWNLQLLTPHENFRKCNSFKEVLDVPT